MSTPDNPPTIDPETAYFISLLHLDPTQIKANANLGGLSDLGIHNFSSQLQTKLSPAISIIAQQPDVVNAAKAYRAKIQSDLAQGTIIISLDSTQRHQLTEALKANGAELDFYEAMILQTSLTV